MFEYAEWYHVGWLWPSLLQLQPFQLQQSCRFIQNQSSCSTVSFALPLNLDTGIGWNLCPKAPQKHHHLRARKRFLCQGSSTGLLWTGRIWICEDRVGECGRSNALPSSSIKRIASGHSSFHHLSPTKVMKKKITCSHHLLIVSWPSQNLQYPSYSPPSESCFILPWGAPRASRRAHPPPTRDPKSLLPGWCLRQCDSWPAQMVNEQ